MTKSIHPIVLIVITCVAIFFSHLDALYVNIMEARNFIAAREMLTDNNWILTTLNGQARYQKPPLPTWLTAISGAIFGIKNIAALRFPAALAALLLSLTTYKFSLKITVNKTLALVSSLVLSTSFLIVFAGRNGQWDIFAYAFMMLCIYQLYQLLTVKSHQYKHALLAALFLGLSCMSKGPVAVYTLLLPFLVAYGIVYSFKNLKQIVIPIVVFVLLGTALASWWYLYVYLNDPSELVAITTRETANWTNYNVRPFYYYWSFFSQSGVWTIPAFIALLYPYLKDRVSNKKGYQFTLLWTLSAVVLLSIIPEKKTRYLLPVLIPLALNTAYYLEYLFGNFKNLKDKRETLPVYINFGIIGLVGIAFPIVGWFFLKDQLNGNWHWFVLLSVALFVISIYLLRKLFIKQIQAVFYATIGFIAAVMCLGLPLSRLIVINDNYKPLSEISNWEQENSLQVYEYSVVAIEMVWDYGKKLPVIERDGKIVIPSAKTFGVLVSEEQRTNFLKTFHNYTVEKVTRYDMNTAKLGSKSHRTRLWRDLYLVTK